MFDLLGHYVVCQCFRSLCMNKETQPEPFGGLYDQTGEFDSKVFLFVIEEQGMMTEVTYLFLTV